MNRRTVSRPADRNTRSEPFEVFTRPQRSLPARIAGLVLRLRAELVISVAAVIGWGWLVDRMPLWGAGLLVGLFLVATLAWPASRRYVVRRCYAVMTRHRLRATFVERRVMNYTGNLPLLLWARPTPVGERVWVLLRAGIDAFDIERNLSHIASACWGFDARVTPHRKVCALVVVDVVRRNPFTGAAISSPLGDPAPARRLHVVPPALPAGGGRSA